MVQTLANGTQVASLNSRPPTTVAATQENHKTSSDRRVAARGKKNARWRVAPSHNLDQLCSWRMDSEGHSIRYLKRDQIMACLFAESERSSSLSARTRSRRGSATALQGGRGTEPEDSPGNAVRNLRSMTGPKTEVERWQALCRTRRRRSGGD